MGRLLKYDDKVYSVSRGCVPSPLELVNTSWKREEVVNKYFYLAFCLSVLSPFALFGFFLR